MAVTRTVPAAAPGGLGLAVLPAIVVLTGLAVLLVPTLTTLAGSVWKSEEQAHGPIVFAVSAWLIWQRRAAVLSSSGHGGISAWSVLTLGLLIYAVGRSQSTVVLEVGSLLLILGGAVAACFGWSAARALAFPILFLVFALPVPSFIIDELTGPLKQSVSNAAESILYAAGYPIARSGVILSIGQYQMLVADACSGLNSMFTLSAIGVVYLYLMKYRSIWRNLLIVLSILPIAFAANVVRVIILVLITYHLGDEAGQGFAHGFAGMTLFVIAVLLLLLVDSILLLFFRREKADAVTP